MTGRATRRVLHALSGLVAVVLTGAAALSALAPVTVESWPYGFSAAPVAVIGVCFAWLHLMTGFGYRRIPFWIAAGTGTIVIFAAVGFAGLSLSVVHSGVAIVAGMAAFAAARFAMSRVSLNSRLYVAGLLLVVAGILVLPGLFAWVGPSDENRINYQGELDELFALLHPAYREYEDEVESYIEEIAADESLTREEQEDLIEQLNERIESLENDARRYRVVQSELEAYAQEVARLRKSLEETNRPGINPEDLRRVTTYREAVRPAVPLVRDFAVKLASDHPGTYYRAPGSTMPSREGLLQVLTIHRYVSASWKYVNDPLFIRGNYYSPADRTIAAGLVGDCDDFATLMASAVEAIGGRARILHGICAEGGHAWAEVYIGNRAAWQQAMSILSARFPGRRISNITPRHADDFWLSLDWQVGIYSCGNSPTLQYESSL